MWIFNNLITILTMRWYISWTKSSPYFFYKVKVGAGFSQTDDTWDLCDISSMHSSENVNVWWFFPTPWPKPKHIKCPHWTGNTCISTSNFYMKLPFFVFFKISYMYCSFVFQILAVNNRDFMNIDHAEVC